MQIGQLAGVIVLYATGYLFIDMAIVAAAIAQGSAEDIESAPRRDLSANHDSVESKSIGRCSS